MRNIKLTIEYDGTAFNGWQAQSARRRTSRQTQSKPGRTVQTEIEKALRTILKEDIKLIGSGRTDSGVHALGQVANFKTSSLMPPQTIQNALNANLPDDIAIIQAEEVPLHFHAQYAVRSKTYRYVILNRPMRCAQQRDFCLFYPYTLNVRAMREAAQDLTGQHDFRSFAASDPARRKSGTKENTVRTIKRLDIVKTGDFLIVDIESNGFLYKMVRNIVGTLLEIGRGKLAKGSVKQILKQKDRSKAGATAKAKGLTLIEVKY